MEQGRKKVANKGVLQAGLDESSSSRRVERAFSGKSHLLKKDREGVASTVGTIMALLVFITFIALLTNSYVPAWMQDNERSHMNEVFNQFGELKGKIDSLIVSAQITGQSTVNLYQPVTLGSEGVPVFANPTAGLLSYIPGGYVDSKTRLIFDYTANSERKSMDDVGGGTVEYYAANRYYVQQWLAYENGAIIMRQEDGQVVRAFPSLQLVNNSDLINIQFTQVNLLGTNITQAGTTPAGLNIDLLYVDSQTYNISGTNPLGDSWTIEITSVYGNAWYSYFQSVCNETGLIGDDYSLTKGAAPGGTEASLVTFTLNHANVLTYNRAYLSITLEM